MTNNSQNRIVFLDEAHRILQPQADALKEDLRSIEGIPNASYVVDGEEVFVFDKLVELVRGRFQQTPRAALAEIALTLLPAAKVSVQEAITQWNIVPYPYTLVEERGTFMIVHQPFNARISVDFVTREEAHAALASLLVGGTVSSKGFFAYRGQPLMLLAPITTESLPPRPDFASDNLPPVSYAYSHLSGVQFAEGFAPVSKELFSRVQTLDSQWQDASARADRHAYRETAQAWGRLDEFDIERLNDAEDWIPETHKSDLAALRACFPELHRLTDASLYWLFDAYQADCCYISGWTPDRDDGFLLYLLGKLATQEVDREEARDVGAMVVFSLSRGDSSELACEFGRACRSYTKALSSLAWRIASAMRFVAKDKVSITIQGAPIFTVRDMYRVYRKRNRPAEANKIHAGPGLTSVLRNALAGIHTRKTTPGNT